MHSSPHPSQEHWSPLPSVSVLSSPHPFQCEFKTYMAPLLLLWSQPKREKGGGHLHLSDIYGISCQYTINVCLKLEYPFNCDRFLKRALNNHCVLSKE